MKMLYVTTIGLTMNFFKPLIKELLDSGHTVDIATNEDEYKVAYCYREWGCRILQIPCLRSPISIANITTVKEIKKIVTVGNYDIVHCHTPIAAACTRLACKGLRMKGVKVIYTAHGFHFYKGAPLKNWLIYYPIEKLCSMWTDVLITINREDYEFAKKHMWARKIEYVSGVGIDIKKFSEAVVERAKKREEIGVPKDAFLLLSVGELNENKNHQIVIKALAKIDNSSIHYVIAGKGEKADELLSLAQKYGVNLHLLGYRSDVAELYAASDIYILPSVREGLNVSMMEAMASSLPLICADNRGTRDYATPQNSIMCSPLDERAYAEAIITLQKNSTLRKTLGDNGRKTADNFAIAKINEQMKKIYRSSIED